MFNRGSTGVFLLLRIFNKLLGAHGSPSSGSLLNLSPHMVVIIIYLFVLDDSLTSERVTTRTEQLTKCFELLQKVRVRLWPCKTSLSPPEILYY